jgi:hypothetical protein
MQIGSGQSGGAAGKKQSMVLLIGMAASTVLVIVCLLVHYEALRLIAAVVPHLSFLRPRLRVVVVVSGAFLAHTAEVWLFALGYWALSMLPLVSSFSIVDPAVASHYKLLDSPLGELETYLYFSVVTFTSLGLGDVVPHGAARLLAGVEAIIGLLLIGWSVTFTYLEMKELWPLHGQRGERGRSSAKSPPSQPVRDRRRRSSAD